MPDSSSAQLTKFSNDISVGHLEKERPATKDRYHLSRTHTMTFPGGYDSYSVAYQLVPVAQRTQHRREARQ